MQLYFEIIEGEKKGARFQIKPGLSIGRKNADIVLRDSKVSGRHAVVGTKGGGLVLIDNNSSNGLKIDGIKHPEVTLTPGTRVQLGRTFLLVIDANEAAAKEAPLLQSWNENLAKTAKFAQSRIKSESRQLSPFNPLVVLEFVQGIQTGVSWPLGYGPREFGPDSLDYSIEEPNIPARCFSLHPVREGVQFKTEHPDNVKLNGQSLSEEILSDGDVIEINATRIQVALKP